MTTPSGRRTRASIDAELELLEAQLQTLILRESDIQKVIDHAQRMKDALTLERLSTEKQKAELEAQKEPINWLPVELLIHIFSAYAVLGYSTDNPHPSVTVSHVCRKWRDIVLDAPDLWRRIVLRGFQRRAPFRVYLERSMDSPLDIDYTTMPRISTSEERYQVMKLAEICNPHFRRVESLSIQVKNAIAFLPFILIIKDHVKMLPRLRHLNVAISAQDPSFHDISSLLDADRIALTNDTVFIPSSSNLRRLKIEKIPLFNFPASLIANLVSLEIVYSPRSTTNHYFVKMSSLCRFLTLTPRLEELVLANTVPYFDVYPSSEAPDVSARENKEEMQPVNLLHLKSIDWTFPFCGDIHRLLSLINAPGLERLDLWVNDPPRRLDIDYVRGYTYTSSSYSLRNTVTYPSLRDLSVQYAGEEASSLSLRNFSFPALEKLAFTNIDTAARRPGGYMPSLPVFPRLESIFRDPRLPNLTHLTLSHFEIWTEVGRVEAMLGYMPLLTSLSLDACPGTCKLLNALQEQVVPATNRVQSARRGAVRGVKLCPRLEALSFWGCQDVDFATLLAVVYSRNRSASGFAEETTHKDESATPNGATQAIVTRGLRDENNGGASHRTEPAQMGRKIKPLRKLRRDPPELPGAPSAENVAAATRSMATVMIHAARRPAQIIYLRMTDCKLISEEEAIQFKSLGVVDVIWSGSDQ
ncbi:hypothetical protein JR316_0011334 [Psilocybe cubensis]|uniref:Uncharacterized protein n=2 Tax=Psilocybe cubensis TaxID=181762 RepID=A0ACB8GL72_PSICU|nr:hypothetical protein JR316_0011334 [Psilocybe cubensis]KAH9475775.1 hypothetical protein JR316_0011334 [Psilocybe cubensis]